MDRPESNEYDPYYSTYVNLVADDDIFETLDAQPRDLRSMLSEMPEERGRFSYAEGKWTIKEVLSHLIDGERIFAYRLLRISRGDETPIEGFEQDGYIENSNADDRTFAELLNEFDLQRRSNLMLIRHLSDEASRRMGTASELPISARALVYIMAGHVLHHAAILKERYSV
ncbi:MAG: DinB family protein [Pyrinomonadaceae bacterium]